MAIWHSKSIIGSVYESVHFSFFSANLQIDVKLIPYPVMNYRIVSQEEALGTDLAI